MTDSPPIQIHPNDFIAHIEPGDDRLLRVDAVIGGEIVRAYKVLNAKFDAHGNPSVPFDVDGPALEMGRPSTLRIATLRRDKRYRVLDVSALRAHLPELPEPAPVPVANEIQPEEPYVSAADRLIAAVDRNTQALREMTAALERLDPKGQLKLRAVGS